MHIAVYYIGTILQEAQDRQASNVPYRPAAAAPGYPSATSAYPPSASRLPPSGSSYYPSAPQPPYGGGAAYPPQGMAAAPGGYPSAGSPPAGAPGDQTQSIYIPNDFVGNIIGKGGAKINEIRQMSSCNIKITEGTESQGTGARPGERVSCTAEVLRLSIIRYLAETSPIIARHHHGRSTQHSDSGTDAAFSPRTGETEEIAARQCTCLLACSGEDTDISNICEKSSLQFGIAQSKTQSSRHCLRTLGCYAYQHSLGMLL